MKIVLIILCVVGWLLISFGTYFLGLCLGVLGTKWVKVVDIYETKEDKSFYDNMYKDNPRRQYMEVSQPNIIKFMQFIFWPVVLPYLIVLMLIKLAEVCLGNLRHKEEERRRNYETMQLIRRIKEWKGVSDD